MTKQVMVIARAKAKVGMEGRVREEIHALLAPTRAEKGCLNYDMHQALGDPASFLIHENWTSEEDLKRHRDSPHVRRWFELSKELVDGGVEVTLWTRVG